MTDVAGTELMLEVTGIMTNRITYHSHDENCLLQTFSHLCKESYVSEFTATWRSFSTIPKTFFFFIIRARS